MIAETTLWDLGELPFLYTPLSQPTNGDGLPDRLRFRLGVDESTGRLLQCSDRAVQESLEEAYRRGSMISGQMDESGIGKSYADAFIEFIRRADVLPTLAGAKVLEVGCGTGYLLYRLNQEGSEVLGVEPGEHGQERFEAKGVPILREFFPTPRITETFDAIVIYGVLEHVENPAEFLRTLGEFLSPGGRIIIAVPDCGPYIGSGDISMLIHEHWSYFTAETLRRTIDAAGFDRLLVTRASFGGFLYAAVGRNGGGPGESEGSPPALANRDFVDKAKAGVAKLVSFVNEIASRGQQLGIYVPARAINGLVTGGAELQHCRFFDDNPLVQNTYFPGIPIPVESRDQLVASPVDHVLVMSHSFGDKIIAQLRPLVPRGTAFTSIRDLLAS